MAGQSKVARELKKLREQAGLSVRDVAKRANMSASSYSYYEDDFKKAFLPVELVQTIAPAFIEQGIDRANLLSLTGIDEGETQRRDPMESLIRFWREKKKISRKQLAQKLKVDESEIAELERDRRQLTKDWIARLSHALDVRPADLVEADMGRMPDLPALIETPPGYEAVNFLEAKAGMGGGALPPEAFAAPRYFESALIASLRASAADLFSMEVEGQSMEGILFSGDQILVHRGKTNISEPGIFVIWDGDGIVCKWVERLHGSEPPMLRIFSENNRFKEYTVLTDEVVIHGRVVWYARRL